MSHQKKYTWYKIADAVELLQWQSNNICIIEINNQKVTISKYNDQLFACAHKCPHAGGIMSNGFIDASGNIVCPIHRYKFDLKSGRNVSGEGYYLKIYPIEYKPDGIYIGFEEKGFLNWL